MSKIKTGTTLTTAYQVEGDTTGTLVIQTGSTPTTAVTVSADQNVTVAGNVTLNNGTADGAQLTLSSSGYSDWNWDNYSGRLRAYYGSTEYFTVNASGNVGIGTSSPNDRLDIGSGRLSASSDTTTPTGGSAYFYKQSTGATVSGYQVILETGSAGSRAERVRIDYSGNVGIGTSSPATPLSGAKGLVINSGATNDAQIRLQSNVTGATSSDGILLSVAGDNSGYLWNYESAPLIFGTNATERMRIDSSGNLMVGILSAAQGGKFSVATSATSTAIGVYTSGTGGTSGYVIRSGDDGAYRFQVFSNGNVQNFNNSYGAISDIKLKENIVDATPKLGKLKQVRVVNYNFIGDEKKQLGVIAQELEQVFPTMVDETPDTDTEGNDLGTTTKSVKYSVFVPILIKAIQEQQSIIEQLTARIEALESK